MSESESIIEFGDKCINASSSSLWMEMLYNDRAEIENAIKKLVMLCDSMPDELLEVKDAKDSYEKAMQLLGDIGEIAMTSTSTDPTKGGTMFTVDGSLDHSAADATAMQLGQALNEGHEYLQKAQQTGQQAMAEIINEREKVTGAMSEIDEAFRRHDYKAMQERIEAAAAILKGYRDSDARARGFKFFRYANAADEQTRDENLVDGAENYIDNLQSIVELINERDENSIGYADMFAVVTERFTRLVDRYEDWADMWKAASQNMSDDHKIIAKVDQNLDDRAQQFQKERDSVVDLAIDAENAFKGSGRKGRKGNPRFKTSLATLEAAKSKMLKHGARPSTNIFFSMFGFWSNAASVDLEERGALVKETESLMDEVLMIAKYSEEHFEYIDALGQMVVSRQGGYADMNRQWTKSSTSEMYKNYSMFR